MSVKRKLGVYENKVCIQGCVLTPSLPKLGLFPNILMQAIGTVMSQNPEHILHTAHVFLHKASHIDVTKHLH